METKVVVSAQGEHSHLSKSDTADLSLAQWNGHNRTLPGSDG